MKRQLYCPDIEVPANEVFGDGLPIVESIPTSYHLEDLRMELRAPFYGGALGRFDPDVPQTSQISLTKASMANLEPLRFLRTLVLNSDVRFETTAFAALVTATPLIESFSVFGRDCTLSGREFTPREMYLGVVGLKLADLADLSGWSRLRTCFLTIGVDVEELSTSLTHFEGGNYFALLKDQALIADLVEEWKGTLKSLENIDVVCHIVKDDRVLDRKCACCNDAAVPILQLIFGLKCGFEQMHFWFASEGLDLEVVSVLKRHRHHGRSYQEATNLEFSDGQSDDAISNMASFASYLSRRNREASCGSESIDSLSLD